MPPSDDPVPTSIRDIAHALLAGDADGASLLASRIDTEHLARQRLGLFESVKKSPRVPAESVKPKTARSSLSEAVKLRVFRRDRFTCRLCDRKTIYLPVLQAISRALPTQMPYQPSWAFGTTHLVYWTHSTSLEHLTPLARAGADEESNFVTSCYACNSARGDYLLDEVKWRLRDPDETSDWDGLSGLLRELVVKYPVTVAARRVGESLPTPPSVVDDTPPELDAVADVPLMTSWIDATTVSVGNFVRIAAEGRTQRRMHRIEAVSGDRATMREMWRENGRWVESRAVRSTRLEGEVELVALVAPAPGSPA